MRHRSSSSVVLALALLVASVAPAAALRRCGDDVDGQRVACRCGDLLVGSRTLTAKDRVTREHCPGNGLLVSADGPVTLTLGGRTLAGEGQGVGILVLRGTLTLVGPGDVVGFGTGIQVRGAKGLAGIVGVRVAENHADGIVASGDGFSIQGTVAERNGRDGFALWGGPFAVDGCRASDNGRYGFDVMAMGVLLGGGLGNEATGNRDGGFWLHGEMYQMMGARASQNRGEGVMAAVTHSMFAHISADDNLSHGVRLMGPAIAFGDVTAARNRGVGVWVSGPGVDDQGGNSGVDNGGSMAPAYMGSDMTPMMMSMMPGLSQCRVGTMGTCK
jgi:hypothetical protein